MSNKEIKLKRLNPKGADNKYIGDEPEWHIQPTEDNRLSQLGKGFNWYNYYFSRKDAKEMIAHYLEFNKKTKEAKKVRSTPDSQIIPTIGWVCRMSMMGLHLTEDEQIILNNNIATLLDYKEEVKEVVEDPNAPPKLTIQDHLREKASECSAELEALFDDFIVGGAKLTATYKPMSIIRSMNISPQMISPMLTVWELRIKEFNSVINEEHEQLVEGYSHLSKAQLRQCIKFCELVINDGNSYIQLKKVERKPRAKKAVSPEKQASKFKYLKEFAELGLKSQAPSTLVNASEAWLYNTATRKLIHVMADAHAGTFTVKGSSVVGFDTLTTVQKTLRKPADQLKTILSGGKPAMRKTFEDVKSTEVKWNGRSNDAIVILKAW